ncbi:MAG: AMP-binding protein [Actinobacteria bacterium]|nr:AMP-binding protein [Actinomycetota bacterium]MCB9390540.1 AMP-binding protein [Acidimicrobiia bacterium]
MDSWSFVSIFEQLAAEVPDRLAVACGDERISYAELDRRANAVAWFLHDQGIGADDKVGIDLVNSSAYMEVFFGAQKIGAVPFNVNYRYQAEELKYLLDNADARAVFVHPDFAEPIEGAVELLGGAAPVLVGVPHGEAPLPDSLAAHSLSAIRTDVRASEPPPRRAPTGDDLIFIYTGGTTGMPKAVMWRSDDLYQVLWMHARPGKPLKDPLPAVQAGKRAATVLPASPLMHGMALFMALGALCGGGTVVLNESLRFDPAAAYDAIEEHQVQLLQIIGDAFARPLVTVLRDQPDRWDLSSLAAISSSGMLWSPETKAAMLELLPHLILLDGLGATESPMTRSVTTAATPAKSGKATFHMGERIRVINDDDRDVQPGSGEMGMIAVSGPIPLGYYKDENKTANTFRTIDGVRYSIPGDFATVSAEGELVLAGRGSVCINTGGEKVFPEEVEVVLRDHPAIYDVVVVGVPHDRWGEMVTAMIQLDPAVGAPAGGDADFAAHARGHLAGYKVPKAWITVESLDRSPSGKADYKALRSRAIDTLPS